MLGWGITRKAFAEHGLALPFVPATFIAKA
jgi:hypothetical protein